MMAVIPQLVARSGNYIENDDAAMTSTMMNLLIALIILFAVGLLCIGVLLMLRSRRKAKKLDEKSQRPASRISHRRLAANTSPINIYGSEKEILVEKDPDSPSSSVPEIRITFPEEDETGNKRISGRVVVVKISDKGGVGLEPYNEDQLPPYQIEERLQSLDLERMGGLKEKNNVVKV